MGLIAGLGMDADCVKPGIKLAVAVIIAILAMIGNARTRSVSRAGFGPLGGLGLLKVAPATLWN